MNLNDFAGWNADSRILADERGRGHKRPVGGVLGASEPLSAVLRRPEAPTRSGAVSGASFNLDAVANPSQRYSPEFITLRFAVTGVQNQPPSGARLLNLTKRASFTQRRRFYALSRRRLLFF